MVGRGQDSDDLLAQRLATGDGRRDRGGESRSLPPSVCPSPRPAGCRRPHRRHRLVPRLARLLQVTQVGVVLLAADHLDVEQHPRVVDAAELGALAAKVPVLVGVTSNWLVRPGTTSIFK